MLLNDVYPYQARSLCGSQSNVAFGTTPSSMQKNALSHNQHKNTLVFYFFTEGFGLSRHLSSSTPQIGTPQQRFLNCVLNIKS